MSSIARARLPAPSISRRRRTGVLLRYIVAVIAIIYALFPVVWIISASVNPDNTLAASQRLIPANATIENYDQLLNDPQNPFLIWMWNSIKIASITSVFGVFITALSAYSFSRFRFRGRRSLLLTILLIQVFPNMLAMVALYIILLQLGAYIPSLGLNTHGGLILIYLGGVMGINVWLMKGFFDTIPRELDESAQVDGASHWQTFWRVIFPLVRPVVAVVGILTFISTYSEFVIARVMLQSTEQFTLAVGLYQYVSQQFNERWGVFAAGALIGAIPVVVVYLLLQDLIVGGLTQGAVKG